MATTPIHYNGDLAAFASPLRVHFTPPLDTAPEGDPVRRVVYAMALYARDVDAGELAGPYSEPAAQLYARALLIPDDDFAAHDGDTDVELARRFSVPVDQIARKRSDQAAPAIRELIEVGEEDLARDRYGDQAVDVVLELDGWDITGPR